MLFWLVWRVLSIFVLFSLMVGVGRVFICFCGVGVLDVFFLFLDGRMCCRLVIRLFFSMFIFSVLLVILCRVMIGFLLLLWLIVRVEFVEIL